MAERQKGGARAKARGMVLQWALLKAMGPDRWHFAAMQDASRLDAFDRAVRRALQTNPDASVVDFGAGNGLIAFLAARQGAKMVTRFERLRPLAKLEMTMGKANDLNIKVLSDIPGEESDSDEDVAVVQNPVAADNKYRADIAIAEVWDPTYLGGQEVGILAQGIFEGLRRLRKAGILSPETVMIPRATTIQAALVALPMQTELLRCPLNSVSGFDLSLFSKFCPEGSEPVYLGQLQHILLSQPVGVFTFDFSNLEASVQVDEERSQVPIQVTESGICNAVVFWHEMELDEHEKLSCGPGSLGRQAVFMLASEVSLVAGQSATLRCTRVGTDLKFELDGGQTHVVHHKPGRQVVQRWHFGMLNDTERNEAFYQALRRQVKPGYKVLDIGAGTGLLGMMAARCGASQVTCCEKCEPLAKIAEQIVEKNKLEKIVKVVHKHSTELQVGPSSIYVSGIGLYDPADRDMAGKADLLVSEIVDCGLLGESAIPSVLHAREHLLKPDAILIPSGAEVFAVAIECFQQPVPLSRPLGKLHDFEMSGFNQFCVPSYEQIRLSTLNYRELSNVQSVFYFDFYSSALGDTRQGWKRFTIQESGTVHAIAFWFRLELDSEVSLTTGPENLTSCWKQAVQFFRTPVDVTKGKKLPIWVAHDQTRISFRLESPGPDDD